MRIKIHKQKGKLLLSILYMLIITLFILKNYLYIPIYSLHYDEKNTLYDFFQIIYILLNLKLYINI